MVVCFFKGKGIQYKSFKEDCFLGLNNKPKRTYASSFPYPLTLLTPVIYVSPARYLTESFQGANSCISQGCKVFLSLLLELPYTQNASVFKNISLFLGSPTAHVKK